MSTTTPCGAGVAVSPSDLSVTSLGLRPPKRPHQGTTTTTTPPVINEVVQTTALVLQDLEHNSPFFDTNPARVLPRFDPKELTTGPELGRGEFGIVLEISSIHLLLDKQQLTFSMATQSLSEMSLASLGEAVHTSNNENSTVVASPPPPPPSLVVIQNGHNNNKPIISSDARDSTVGLNVTTALTHHRRNTSVTFVEDVPDSKTAESNEESHSRHSSEVTDDTATEDIDNRSEEHYEDNVSAYDDEDEDKQLQQGDSSLNCSGHYNNNDARNDSDAPEPMTRMRDRFAKKAVRDGKARFALKQVRQDVDQSIKLDAVLDLACEARYLQSISHSNIIRLRGIQGDPGTPSFGLVLDRLVTTLDRKVEEWRTGYSERHGGINKLTGVFRRQQNKELDKMLYADRVLVALDVARAMRHLHRKKILYRDIKPENIGFNVRGDVQIFDFGLAKELHSKDLVEDTDGYEATGLTGSRRFMAPEVVRCLPYGFSADVFSFAILFWLIFALKTPFANYDANRHFEKVVEGKQRPHRLRELSPLLHRMMEDAWDDDRHKRPLFKQICRMLQTEIVAINGLLHNSRSDDSVMNRTSHLLDRSLRSLSNISDVFSPEPSAS